MKSFLVQIVKNAENLSKKWKSTNEMTENLQKKKESCAENEKRLAKEREYI